MAALPRTRFAGVAGALLVLPALVFIGANVLNELGVSLVYDSLRGLLPLLGSPVVMLGGLLGALGLNALALAGIAWRREGEAWTATITLQARAFNLAVAGIALTLLGFLFLYLVGENCGPRV